MSRVVFPTPLAPATTTSDRRRASAAQRLAAVESRSFRRARSRRCLAVRALPARTPPGEWFLVSRLEAHTRILHPGSGRAAERPASSRIQSVSIFAMYGRSRNWCRRARAISGERNVRHGESATHDRHINNSSRLPIQERAGFDGGRPVAAHPTAEKGRAQPVLNTSWTRVTGRPASDAVGGRDTRTRLGPGPRAAIDVSATRSRSTGTPKPRRFSPSDARNRSDPEPTPTSSGR